MKTLFLPFLSFSSSFAFMLNYYPPTFSGRHGNTSIGMTSSSATEVSKPLTLVVTVDVKPDRMEEFLKVIENDTIETKKEPGYIHFDVLQSQEDTNKFIFYEIYKDSDALDYHLETPHFAAWNAFVESGGVAISSFKKADGIFLSDCCSAATTKQPTTTTTDASKPVALVVEADINPDRMQEFLEIIEVDAIGTRKEPGCLRFDVVQSQEDPNKFFFYEIYKDWDAVLYHLEQPHFTPYITFKKSGGVVCDETVSKTDGIFMC